MTTPRPPRIGPDVRRESVSRRAPGRWVWALTLLACGGAGRAPPARPAASSLRQIERLLPEGAEWIVLARPAELWRAAAVRRALTPAIGDGDLSAFATRTGIHLVTQEELAAGGYGARGTVVILRGPDTAKSVRRTQQLAAVRPFEFRAIRPDVVAVATGPAATTLLSEARRRALRRPLPPLAAPVARMRDLLPVAPLQLLVLAPLEVERDTPAAVLLSGVRRVAVSGTPRGAEIAFRVNLQGDFPPTAAENFRRMIDSMADTSIGEMFGLADVARGARIEASLTQVQIDSAMAAAAISTGIETLFIAKLRELLGSETQSSDIPPESPKTTR